MPAAALKSPFAPRKGILSRSERRHTAVRLPLTPVPLILMPMSRRFLPLGEAQAPFFVGVDLGGTNIKVGVVDDHGRPLSWSSVETEPQRGAEDGMRRMAQ